MIKIINDPNCRHMDFELLEDDPSFICRTTLRHPGKEPAGLRDLALASGIPVCSVARIRQVHSDRIHECSPTESSGRETPEADGMIINGAGMFGVLRTADCVPVVIVNPGRKISALVHAGWKGTCSRITRQAAQRVLELSSGEPGDLHVFAGPCIHACCYEVGTEVISAFAGNGHDIERLVNGNMLDLVKANLGQAVELGITNISSSGFCTCCNSDLFYSYRKNRASERMLTLAGFLP